MITRIVKMTFQLDKAKDFETYFVGIKNKVAEQPGCNGVKLLKDINNSSIFFTYSKWDSENDLDLYRNSEVFGMIWPKVKKWFSDTPEAWTVVEG